jgi:hypothetical protein
LKTTRFHHRFFAGLLAVGILALLISTISLVINSAVRTPPSSATATLPTTAKTLDTTSFLASYISHKGNLTPSVLHALERPYVTFSADTLAPSDDKLNGTLEVILPPGLPPFMTMNGTPVFTNCANAPCPVKPRFANLDIIAKVLVTGTGANFETQESIPLKDFSAGSTLGLHEFPLTLPVKGYAGWYPQDKYTANITLALALPSGMMPSMDSGPHSVIHGVNGGSVANTYNVKVAPTPVSFQQLESNSNDTFALTIARDWYQQFFVYTVALIPLLFAILFFHLLFISGSGHGIGRSFEHFTEALVVSVLSVLPLRVVLVPGDITGLTRVDLVLGVGLVLIVAVAAGKYAREIWTGTQSPPEEDEAEKMSRVAFPIPEHEGPAREEPPTSAAASTAS